MSNLTENVSSLIDNQVNIAQLFNDVVAVLWQHELAIGVNPNASTFNAFQERIKAVALDPGAAGGLNFMRNTLFEIPPAEEAAPETPPAEEAPPAV